MAKLEAVNHLGYVEVLDDICGNMIFRPSITFLDVCEYLFSWSVCVDCPSVLG